MSKEEAVAIFRFIARTFPKKFREKYAHEMIATFSSQLDGNMYSFKKQWFIHRSLLDVLWLSIEENLNIAIGLLLALGGSIMLPGLIVADRLPDEPLPFYLLDRAIGWFGILIITASFFILYKPVIGRNIWKIILIYSFFISFIYAWQAYHLYREQLLPFTIQDGLTFLPFVALPPILSLLIGKYLKWREQVVG